MLKGTIQSGLNAAKRLNSSKKKALIATTLLLSIFTSCKKDELETLTKEDALKIPQKLAVITTNTNSSLNKPITLGYYPSWNEGWLNDDGISPFTSLPSSVTHIFFAFAKPNLTYIKGSYNIATSNTGLECYSTPDPKDGGLMLKRAVAILKQKGISVILSIGGETYWNTEENFNDVNYQQIKDLVDDIGFAGIDWDFEPNASFSDAGNALNVSRLTKYITESRKLMPKTSGYLITTAPSGVGALGGLNNDDPSSPFAYNKRNALTNETDAFLYNFIDPTKSIGLFGFSSTGAMIPVIKAVGDQLDIIAYQAYNTGAAPNRKLMYDSYAYYANQYGFKLAHGTHVPSEPWGPYFEHTPDVVADLAKYIHDGGSQNRAGKNDGIMIWNLALLSNKNTNYTGVTYLNVANKILNGQTKEAALANAFDYKNETTNPTIPPVTPPTNPPTNPPVTGTGGCGIAAYDATRSYPIAGTKVYFKGKIYKNKWYVNTNQVPESEEWGPWEFVENCDLNTTPPTTTPPTTPPVVPPGTSGNGCGVAVYDTTKAYPNPGTEVFYKGKIYKNKWYANANQVPEGEQWGPWEFVRVCS
ncbi:hypothetical protein ACTJKC_16760 [Pedobacter sp. 22226]|uniref:hypothetical protein n=1 Tax=Pedobacter sp. 22226 TaxID=3453894 RepID=UPI003F840F34